MTDSQTSELVAIAAAAGFRAEYHPTNPPKLIGFGKFTNGKYDYGIRVDDFAAIVQAARLSALEEVEALCEALLEQHDPGGDCSAGMGFRDAIEAATEAIGQLAAQAGKPQGEKT